MSQFIRTQLTIVLQPFLDHVESNDKRIAKLEDLVETSDDRITGTLQELDATNSTVAATIEKLRLTDKRVEVTGEGVQRHAERMDHLQRGIQVSQEYTERVDAQVRGVSSETPELRRSSDDLRKQLQALQTQFNRVLSDGVVASNKARLDSLEGEVAGLKVRQEKSESVAERLHSEVREESRLLHDTRQEVHNSNNSIGAVQQAQKDILVREKEFERRLEGFNAQWNKLQTILDGLKKDAAFLKQSAESHDASIHGIQRGQQNLTESVDGLNGAHAKMRVELDATQRALKQTNQAVAVAQDNIGQNASFANGIHSRLDKAASEISSTTGHLRVLEGKHEALSDVVNKNAEKQGEILLESRRNANEDERTQRILQTTSDSVASVAKQLEVVSRGLNGTKGELVHSTDRVTKIEQSLKEFHGAFQGLQKGFVDSGLEMGSSVASKKTGRLPKVVSPSVRPGSGSTLAGTPRSVGASPSSTARERLAFFPGGDGSTAQDIAAWKSGVHGVESPFECSPMSSRAVTKDSS
jgi:chromosome segregation ATPase